MDAKIIILANSVKRSEHCVAGIDENGNWIRPISNNGEGELTFEQIRFSDYSTPNMLDLVKIGLDINANNPSHPEDYYINGNTWELLGRTPISEIDDLINNEHDLWFQAGERTDRISNQHLLQRNTIDSICLIRVTNFILGLSTEYNSFNDYNKKKRMIYFNHHGRNFSFSLTDPVFGQVYCRNFPDVEQPERLIQFNQQSYFCISLTPALNGYHYKIIASIIS